MFTDEVGVEIVPKKLPPRKRDAPTEGGSDDWLADGLSEVMGAYGDDGGGGLAGEDGSDIGEAEEEDLDDLGFFADEDDASGGGPVVAVEPGVGPGSSGDAWETKDAPIFRFKGKLAKELKTIEGCVVKAVKQQAKQLVDAQAMANERGQLPLANGIISLVVTETETVAWVMWSNWATKHGRLVRLDEHNRVISHMYARDKVQYFSATTVVLVVSGAVMVEDDKGLQLSGKYA